MKVARGLGDGGFCSSFSVCRRGERHQCRATGQCVSPCPTLPVRALKRCTRDDELQGFCGLSGRQALQETEKQREASLPDSGGNGGAGKVGRALLEGKAPFCGRAEGRRSLAWLYAYPRSELPVHLWASEAVRKPPSLPPL